MSSITARYVPFLEANLQPYKTQVKQACIKVTAEVLGVDPKGVVVEFVPWTEPFPVEAPEVLFRAETSLRRRDQLIAWGDALIFSWKSLAEIYPGLFQPGMKIAAKLYVIDSEWREEVL